MQVELLAEEEVVKNDHDGSDKTHQERLVCAIPLLLVKAPHRVSEQQTAEWDQDRGDACHRHAESGQVRSNRVRVDREALAIRTESGGCLSQRIEYRCETSH